jgi:dUTPase
VAVCDQKSLFNRIEILVIKMIYSKLFNDTIDLRESLVYPDCYDIFNSWPNLRLRKNGATTIELGVKVIAGLGEKCVMTDRYGYCVTNGIHVENKVVADDLPIFVKLINRTNSDVFIPHGEILCQIMVFTIDMVGR